MVVYSSPEPFTSQNDCLRHGDTESSCRRHVSAWGPWGLAFVVCAGLLQAGCDDKEPADLSTLEAALTALSSRVQTLETDLAASTARVTSLESQVSSLQNNDGAQSTQLTGAADRLDALEGKTASLRAETVGGQPAVIFEGVNLFVQNGAEDTESANGRGNLVLGYNEPGGTESRGGSHNLVIGTLHSYESWGGMVVGQDNRISMPFASVAGGVQNSASGSYSSVAGGRGNIASGEAGAVAGGSNNVASGTRSAVSGGFNNEAQGLRSTVGGGSGLTEGVDDAVAPAIPARPPRVCKVAMNLPSKHLGRRSVCGDAM
ncbi:MAG: hypothetical protein R3C68_00450 [Myxococcota bacterium]